ncbi:hypothetical protein G9C85_04885 [Halorubellus sp. JP-L1]|uniref:hypothetical protein n=1 Tax=Halorubellus sp. JP-L1 TaxID=2715753 RepID=UPI0014098BC9|nr:hypothetical protein [Halorubellus sp. JP-L1]NHN40972.1 hypothetical protein [Halorubellus sp. JP-L1]
MAVDISLFVSLLFVVVVEIGGIARSLDLETISEQKLPPFFVGLFFLLDTGSQDAVGVPQLGRFNFLHGANLGILMLGFVLVSTSLTGLTRLLVSIITFVIWALLPLLEVDEYEAILIDGYRPVSYYHHAIVSLATALLIYEYDSLWSALAPATAPSILQPAGLLVVCIAGYYVMLFGFLKHLERELDREDTGRLPDRLTRTDP